MKRTTTHLIADGESGKGGVLFFADKGFDKNAFCNICTAIKASKLNGGTFRLGPALSNENLLDHFVEMHLLLLVSQHQNCSRNIQFDIYLYMWSNLIDNQLILRNYMANDECLNGCFRSIRSKNDPIIKQTTFPVDVFLCLYIRSKEYVDVDVPDKAIDSEISVR
ncbi:hypothetical protein T08_2989 [Trichinella sp. T8]|nr:hypothetical protein T08_2989 [Trichinella sp. T8]